MLLSMENKEPNPLGSNSTIPIPMMTSTESLRASGLERNTGIWYLFKHNWRQLTSLIPGLILLSATGNLHISWTIWQVLMYIFDYHSVEMDLLLAWFIGVAGGGIFGAFLNSAWSKIVIYYSIAVALMPVSVTFVLHENSSYNLLLIGRALVGILYGVTLVTLILHIADNSSQFMRRHFMWTISAINLLPTVLLAEVISIVTGFSNVCASIGVIMFVLAILTLIFMPCTYESIIFLLENGTDLRALEIMLKLRNESRHYIRRDFNEFKMMLAEDYADGGNIFGNGNSRPLFLVLLLRFLSTLLTSNCVYWIFLTNIWFDYKYWMRSMNLTTQMLAVAEHVLANQTDFNETFPDSSSTFSEFELIEVENITSSLNFTNSTDDPFSTFFSTTTSSFNDTSLDYDLFSSNFNETFETPIGTTSALTTNSSSFASHLFVHTAYSYQLPVLQITQFLLIVSILKLVVGIPILCFAERFQVYRNRVIFKVTFGIGLINFMFFIGTLISHNFDDSLLFTFYVAKLLSIIYGFYLLIAFSIDTIGFCELGESFSLTKRYGCIACIVICEHLFHAIAILLIMNALFKFYFHVIQSVAICFICYLLLISMPNECLNITLRTARDKYFVKMATTNN